MNVSELIAEGNRLSHLIDAGLELLQTQVTECAEAENAYRREKQVQWTKAPRDEPGERDWTAKRREEWVNAQTADLRQKRDIAEGMKDAAREAVRARRQQLSFVQSALNAHKAEAEFARVGV